ncbi:MAG: MBL fold metallo-hydrolase [Flavobacteriaceae bacterium]|nr:MBL fold metallo-hydrolase [Flavobacteriaceae bacterium]
MKTPKTISLLIFSLTFLLFTLNSYGQDGRVTPIADNVYAFSFGFDAASEYNSLFIVTDDGVIAIESVNTAHSTAFLKAIKETTNQPIKYLLLSHNHWDHTGGGKIFKEAGAIIVAHQEATEWMKDNPHSDVVLPDFSWSGEKKIIKLGDKTVELLYHGRNHGYGMTTFFMPNEKVAYIADVITPGRALFTMLPDFHIQGWLNTLSEIDKLDFNKAIYSHSYTKTTPLDTKEWVSLTSNYIKDLQKAIGAEFAKGTPLMEISTTVKLPQYAHLLMYEEWLPMNVWRILLDGGMGPFSWAPTKH